MTITKQGTTEMTIILEGRLDTITAPQLEEAMHTESPEMLILDMQKLDYISSAGLRVILKLRRTIQGQLIIRNANDLVREVFDLTGFSELLTFV